MADVYQSLTLRESPSSNAKEIVGLPPMTHMEIIEYVSGTNYAYVTVTAGESEGIVHMLMDISDPSDEIKDAIEGAVNWFRKVAIKGIRIERVPLPPEKVEVPQRPYDRIVVEDPAAPPIWARYYDVDDNTPFFCNRDGIKVYKLSDVKMERRTGYAWYGYWPQSVLDRYPKWKAATDKHGQRKNR